MVVRMGETTSPTHNVGSPNKCLTLHIRLPQCFNGESYLLLGKASQDGSLGGQTLAWYAKQAILSPLGDHGHWTTVSSILEGGIGTAQVTSLQTLTVTSLTVTFRSTCELQASKNRHIVIDLSGTFWRYVKHHGPGRLQPRAYMRA